MKKNKNGVALLEAVLAMTIMIFIVGFIAFIISDVKKHGDRNDEILTMMQVERFKNNVIFLKSRLISKGKQVSQNENDLFYGWDKLKITSTQTFDEIEGNFKLANGTCDTGLGRCLEELGTDEFHALPLGGDTIRYEEDINGNLVTDPSLVEDTSIDCSESGPNCLEYRIIISNQPAGNYEPVSYTTPSGIVKTLNDKKIVTIEIKKGDRTETQKFNYLLSIY